MRDVDCGQHRSTPIDNAIPSIEVPEKPCYLGFGSRGPRHDTGSYISWSESVYTGSPLRRKLSTPVKSRQQSLARSEKNRVIGTERVLQPLTESRPANPSLTNTRDDRVELPFSNSANQLAARSHSLPVHSHSTQGRSSIHPSSLYQGVGSDIPPPSAPASMGCHHIQGSPHRQQGKPTVMPEAYPSTSADMPQAQNHAEQKIDTVQRLNFETIEPQLSTLGRLLRECDSVFQQMKGLGKRTTNVHKQEEEGKKEEEGEEEEEEEPPIIGNQNMGRISRDSIYVMQPESYAQSPAFDSYLPRLPDLSRPSLYEEQARRWNAMEEEADEDEYYIRNRDVDDMGVGRNHAEEEEGWDAEGLPGEVDYYGECMDEVGDDGEAYGAVQGEDEEEEEEAETMDEAAMFVGEGFWRPHKLYY
jgi:hypothetical protein